MLNRYLQEKTEFSNNNNNRSVVNTWRKQEKMRGNFSPFPASLNRSTQTNNF